jgi:hypothetical protein
MGWLNPQPCPGSGYFNETIYPSLVGGLLLFETVSWPNSIIAWLGRGGVIADIDQLPFAGTQLLPSEYRRSQWSCRA